MRATLLVRRSLTWTAAALAALIVLAAGLVAAVEAGYGRGLVVRYVASRVGRPVQVNGALHVHLLSRNPSIVAEGVTVDNPPWMPVGRAAEIGRASVVLRLPGFWHRGGVVGLDMEAVTLYLARDATGRANWQMTDPARKRVNRNSAIVRSLSVPKAHVILNDALRHLQFDGTVSARDLDGPTPQPFRIEGTGQLNGRAASFELTGEPLATASHKSPYHFTFVEHSRDSQLEGRGLLPQPFAYDIVDATFEAHGPDLKDLYFLTGVHLMDTGDYRLKGSVSRRGKHTVFSDLAATSGQSDMRGTVSTDSSSGRPKLGVDLSSNLLRLSDLGIRAAGRTSEPKSPLLLSNAMLSPKVLHGRDAAVTFRAAEVDVGRLPLHAVSVSATINEGVLTVAPLLAEVLGGHVNAHLKLDARKEVPAAKVDIRITDLQLGQIPHKDSGQAPMDGLMRARVLISGAGSSIHQIAASANGTVRAQVPRGAIRESLAELTGIDLRGLGLLLAKNKREIPVRCAVANFKAQEGILIAQSLVVDTDPVLIEGEGQVRLDSEDLDLGIRGHPKSVRLFRLRAPILVLGTLAHPSVKIQGSKSVLVVVDPGRAKDADCTALLAAAD